jgi:hypothetical protein
VDATIAAKISAILLIISATNTKNANYHTARIAERPRRLSATGCRLTGRRYSECHARINDTNSNVIVLAPIGTQ